MKAKIGYWLILCSFLPWAGLPVVPLLDLSAAQMATVSTVLVVSAEGIFYLGLLLAGRQAWERIKTYFPWYKAPELELPSELIVESGAQNQHHADSLNPGSGGDEGGTKKSE